MKFSSSTLLAVYSAINLVGHKADAQPEKPEKHQPFVADASSSFNEPTNNRGVNPNRLVVTMTGGSASRLPLMTGAKQGETFDDGAHTVVEFNKDTDREEFLKQAEAAGVTVEEDPPIYPFEVQVDHDVSRNLQEERPWGISDVFTRENGIVDIPGPEYYPSQTKHVCIIDSGYEINHPDLVDDAENADPAQGSTYNVDGCKHGTHVAGTILATDNNVGVIGVFPGAKAWIVKVFGSNGSTSCGWSYSSSLVTAAQHCRDKGADIISMSLGGGGSSSFEENAFKALNDDNGILNIAAAGNGGNGEFSYPASYDSIMSVGATDVNKNIASFSQHNSQVDISGPGVSVKSTTGSTGYSSYSGTSMATPHVSGVALLLWNKYPTCTNNEIREALESSALDRGSPGKDIYFGHGIVRYWAAVDFLTNKPCGTTSPPTISPQPTSAPTPCQGASFELDLLTDNYGSETSWKVERGSDIVVQGSGYSSNTAYNVEDCLVQAGEYKFTINDTYGDGICCSYGSGSYEVSVAGEVVKSGGQFTSTESVTFNVNLSPTTPPPVAPPTASPVSPPTTPPTSSPTKGPTSSPTKSPTSSPTPSPSTSPTVAPVSPPTTPPTSAPVSPPATPPTLAPVSSPTNPAPCKDLEVKLTTDKFGSETSWELINDDSDAVVHSGGPYDNESLYTITNCIPEGSYTFLMKDSEGDGMCCDHGSGSYTLTLDGVVIHNGNGEFGSEERIMFQSPSVPCSTLDIEVKTDIFFSETSWDLKDGSRQIILSSGQGYDTSNSVNTAMQCLIPGRYTFSIFDSFGDGLCCGHGSGYYKLKSNGVVIHSGGEFASQDAVTLDVTLAGVVVVSSNVRYLAQTGTKNLRAGKMKKASLSNAQGGNKKKKM